MSLRLRLGVVTTSYPRAPGDPAGGFVAGFARWLAAEGHEVDVVAAGPGAVRDGAATVTRVRPGASLFYGEGAPDRLERGRGHWRVPVFAAAQLAVVAARSRRWDAVVSHWLAPSSLAIALAAPRLPHLAVAHSADVHLIVTSGLGPAVVALLAARDTRLVFVAAHLRAALAAAVRPGRLRTWVESRAVQPMGIDDPAPRCPPPAQRPRTIGFLGRLVPVKGIDVLLRAVARTGQSLIVGGDGPLRGELERQAAAWGARARFVGEVRDRDVFFADIDCLAAPSRAVASGRSEGTPVVVLEALAAGVPLVASDLPGIRAVAADAARLVPPDDIVALADALAAPVDLDHVARGRERGALHTWPHVGPALWRIWNGSRAPTS